jgi:hypothetical protein
MGTVHPFVRPLRAAIVSALAAAALLPAAAQAAAHHRRAPHARTSDAAPALALTDAQKREQMLDILQTFVPHAESYWRASDLKEPDTGYYAATGSGVTQPRGAGDVAEVEATLLTARPDQASFGGIPRATMLDHTIQSIRHEALTNVLSGAGYKRWGNGTWQASLETYGWGFAAHLLWGDLEPDTRALVQRVVTSEADILITKPIASGEYGDTGAEDSGWNTPTPALAAIMFPDDPHAADWRRTAEKLALNASSTAADRTSDQLVDGTPLSQWIASTNLHPDLTLENHGFFNPIYQQVTHTNIGEAAMMDAQAGQPVPQAFSFRTEEIWNHILGPLSTDDGDITMPAGQDWTSKDFQHLDYLSILATRFHRADASVLESRALGTVARRQASHPDGAILDQPALGYESMLVKRLAAAYWNHTVFGPSPTPDEATYDAARATTGGVHQYPFIDVVENRSPQALATMSWDDARPMGLFLPGLGGHADDPVFSAYPVGSLTGSAAGAVGPYACECGTNRFSTAGTIGGRRFSMTSFPDGVTLLLDRGTGATFNLGLERIDGLTGARPVYSQGGTGLGTLPGTWVDVADRVGMVVAGGGGITAANVTSANPLLSVVGSSATGSGNRGAALYPLLDHARVAQLAPQLDQPTVPDGWSALLAPAPDGTDRLAVARWAGDASAALDLTDARGAPVTAADATLRGDVSHVTETLASPASHGELMRFFVHTDRSLSAHGDGEQQAVLRNDGDAPVHADVTYLGTDGRVQHARRVLAAGEQTTARLLDGRLTLAGPELEPLTQARATVAQLAHRIPGWLAQDQLGADDAMRLGAAVGRVLQQLDIAIAAARAPRPATARAAVAVDVALRELDALDRGLPAAVRGPVLDARHAAEALLTQVREQDLTVTLRLDALDAVLPGEPTPMHAAVMNRGKGTASDVRLALDLPTGWRVEQSGATPPSLRAGEAHVVGLTVTAAATVDPGTTARLHGTLSYRRGDADGAARASLDVTVGTLLGVTAGVPKLPLAAGGFGEERLTLTNHASRDLAVDVQATLPDGVTVESGTGTAMVPANGTKVVALGLRNAGSASGSGRLGIDVSADGAHAVTSVELDYSDDLARNPVGAPWPSAFADSSQAAYPPALMQDGNAATFWVAAGTAAGQGPTPTHPVAAGVDFGATVEVGSLTMTPRTGYGPKAYTIETSADGTTWQQVAAVPAAANGPVTTSFTPVAARRLRIVMTAGWDPTQPARNVQIAGLSVRRR